MIRFLGGLTITRAALLAIGIMALAVEVWALVSPRTLPLISPTMRRDGLRWVTWPTLWGVLGGHFWAPPWLRFELAVRVGACVLIPFGVAVVAFDLLGPRVTPGAAFLFMVAGVLVGAIFWSQR